jgi:dehydrogenase/reductase SDR family member 12
MLSALDNLLDQLVLPSYTWPGYALRSLTWDKDDLDVDLSGKVVLLTGGNAGLGLAAAERLAGLGATVYVAARNRERNTTAVSHIRAHTGNQQVYGLELDLSERTAVAQFAAHFQQQTDRLDILIHNASVLLPERRASADGLEMTLATNLIGPFLLSHLLLPLLEKSAPARVIWVSSGGMYTQKLDLDALQEPPEPFNGTIAYAQSKRAQIIISRMMAERWQERDIAVNAMHPGWADTPGVQTSLPTFRKLMRLGLRSPEQGADTIVWLAAAPKLAGVSGQFWFDRRPRPAHKFYLSTQSPSADRQALWALCQRLSEVETRD